MPLLDFRDVSIIITTYNRKRELVFTLNTLQDVISPEGIYIWDDASTDGTFEYISKNYPDIKLYKNDINQGLIANRNRLMAVVKTRYLISLDDDAHFITPKSLLDALCFMEDTPNCAVLSFRLYWGLKAPKKPGTQQEVFQVRNYLGGAHLMKREVWNNCIKSYPQWYHFYGEEDYASLKLYRKGLKIFYFPKVLVHHRVHISDRKKNFDYSRRAIFSLHAAWSNYLIFYPKPEAYFKIVYSVKEQIRLKLLKGQIEIIRTIFLAFWLLMNNYSFRNKISLSLSRIELKKYLSLPQAPIYWTTND